MNTWVHSKANVVFCLLSLVALLTLMVLAHPVVLVLADEIIPVH